MFDIAGIDSPRVELSVQLGRFPKANGIDEIAVASWQGGPKVTNSLITASRLGRYCAILGAVGDDVLGAYCSWDFERHNVENHLIYRSGSMTAFLDILSSTSDHGQCILYRPSSSLDLQDHELDLNILCHTKYFVISHLNDINMKAAKIAKEAGAVVIYAANRYERDLFNHIANLDIIVGSKDMYKDLFTDSDYETNCQLLMKKGLSAILFTRGSEGCVGYGNDVGYFSYPAYYVTVVDTFGAGSTFLGAFLSGLLEDYDTSHAASYANAAAAISCTQIGSRAGIPDNTIVQNFLEKGIIDHQALAQRAREYEYGLDNLVKK